MRILYYFLAYTTGTSKPVTIWVEANNQLAAREKIMKENPYVSRLQFQRTKRIE